MIIKVEDARRSIVTPLRGITFEAHELKQISDLTNSLVVGKVDLAILRVMKRALAYESIRLESASEWATGDNELVKIVLKNSHCARVHQQTVCLISYKAVTDAHALTEGQDNG